MAVAAMAAAVPQAAANSKYAAIVIDARTGRTLFERHADAARFPASLTKMMTLYMVFEAMERGRISRNSPVTFSRNAAAEPPTKLGVKAGGSITFDTAIKALVTRSANDVSTAIAETLGGSEANFAQMMTQKARNLGMRNTTFRNAHGLPNAAQKTTARDIAILSIALREHFPRYYDYFSTRSFTYGKQRINSHNRMFGRLKGVDGIKTGYTRASGFNLATSVQANNRSVVAVVLGGRSARSRDDHMAALLNEHFGKAATRGGGGALVAARERIRPTEFAAAQAGASRVSLPSSGAPIPDSRPDAVMAYAAPTAPVTASAVPSILPTSRPQAPVGSAEQMEVGEGDIDMPDTGSLAAQSGWVIQIASTGTEAEAHGILAKTASEHSRILSGRTPFTEEFVRNGTHYHRARYAGFDSKDAAWNACNALKRQRVDCYAVER